MLFENTRLAVPTIHTVKKVTVEECQRKCSNFLLPCNGFVYNLIRRQCDLQNETRDTEPKTVCRRPGFRLYQKRCFTGTFSVFFSFFFISSRFTLFI